MPTSLRYRLIFRRLCPGGAEKRDHHQRFAACIGICRCADTRVLLIAATATHIGFFVAAGGWIAMFIATLFLPRRGSSPEQRSVIRELATGFRFIRGHRVLLVLMGFDWIGLLPEYVDQLGGGAREVGFVFSSVGIGGSGPARWPRQLGSGRG